LVCDASGWFRTDPSRGGSYAWAVLRLLATYAADLPSLCGSRKQGLPDRLAGTTVVIDQ
jgi:hypothetical protein